MLLLKEDFGHDFHWGVSTAAYQIEGAHDKDGKGPSIWDSFVKKKKRIFSGHDGDIACDFYNRFESDNEIIRSLNIPNHRFSISWSRIIPEGTGRINRKGIDFYNRLIDHSLELGITPWVTLYHWDLPQSLQDEGGWANRDVVSWFSNYAEVCIKHFGDRVKNWMILNEPMVFTGAGYFFGVHAPGKKGLGNFLSSVHHAALCQAEGARIIRAHSSSHNIGTTFSCSHIEPYSSSVKDVKAADRVDALLNRLFIEPLLGLGYPAEQLPLLKRIEKFIKAGDIERLKFDMDFIGVQNYTREIVKYHALTPFMRAKIVAAPGRKVNYTVMNWEVYPEAIYQVLKKFSAYKTGKLIVTENGAAFPDEIVDGNIEDTLRLNYIRDHLQQVLRAKNDGINVNGYFIWTLLDNFEWAEGFNPKFGIVHVDRVSLERKVKASGKWYKSFLAK